MTKDDYLEWLKAWFGSKLQLPWDADTRDIFSENGLTSLDTLTLVIDIENQLNISLTDESFVDKRFSTLLGLSEILDELGAHS